MDDRTIKVTPGVCSYKLVFTSTLFSLSALTVWEEVSRAANANLKQFEHLS